MRHFKLPAIVTGIVLALAMIFGIVAVTLIHKSKLPDREKTLRAQKLGAGTAGITLLIITPFWMIAAAKVGKERRKARDTAHAPQNHTT